MNSSEMKVQVTGAEADQTLQLGAALDVQRAHRRQHGAPDYEARKSLITRTIELVADNKDALVAAMSADYGNRSREQSLMSDIAATISELKYARKHMKHWIKPERAKVDFPLNLLGSKAWIEYQPVGVVGIVAPWNFPIFLSLGPLAEIFAAGNSAVLKPSEYTPETSELLRTLAEKYFQPHELTVVTGGVEVGIAFTKQPFDHLLFTGATSIARHVLHAAADNLMPVTLELGGKSPVIVGESADMELAARRVAGGKLFNAGQVCLAPDYAMVPKGRLDQFVSQVQTEMAKSYPSLKDNPDYTSIATDRSFERLRAMVDQARQQGANVIEVNPADEDLSTANHRAMAPTIIVDPDESLEVMQDEIFGPILPVLPYESVDEAIDFVNDRERPLALYYFGDDSAEQDRVLNTTTSGGVTINDVIMHSTQNTLPFGGIGHSGMGAYHGIHGFRRFSHAKAVYKQTKLDFLFGAIRPPYTESFFKFIGSKLDK